MFSASLHFILMRNLRSVRLREGDPGPRLTDQLLYHTGKCLEVAMECAWTRSEHLDLPDPKIYVKNTLLVFWVCTLVSQMYLGSDPPPQKKKLQPFSGFLQESSQSKCRCQPAKQLWTRRPLYPLVQLELSWAVWFKPSYPKRVHKATDRMGCFGQCSLNWAAQKSLKNRWSRGENSAHSVAGAVLNSSKYPREPQLCLWEEFSLWDQLFYELFRAIQFKGTPQKSSSWVIYHLFFVALLLLFFLSIFFFVLVYWAPKLWMSEKPWLQILYLYLHLFFFFRSAEFLRHPIDPNWKIESIKLHTPSED